MHIDREIKLDFKDVLIRPKRSALPSRAQVDITREFTFKHSQHHYCGVPIIAANMDTTGTFEMTRALAPFGLSVALHKHYGVDELAAFFKALKVKANAFYSMGITQHDRDKFARVQRRTGKAIQYVCIDVANGYTESFVKFVAKFRHAYPEVTLMAGNVVTGEMTEELVEDEADCPFGRIHSACWSHNLNNLLLKLWQLTPDGSLAHTGTDSNRIRSRKLSGNALGVKISTDTPKSFCSWF